MNRNEQKFYFDINRIADALESIAKKLKEENKRKSDAEWKLEDGTVLDQESQDALNDAMLNMVNENGLTLKQVWDKEIEDNKKGKAENLK